MLPFDGAVPTKKSPLTRKKSDHPRRPGHAQPHPSAHRPDRFPRGRVCARARVVGQQRRWDAHEFDHRHGGCRRAVPGEWDADLWRAAQRQRREDGREHGLDLRRRAHDALLPAADRPGHRLPRGLHPLRARSQAGRACAAARRVPRVRRDAERHPGEHEVPAAVLRARLAYARSLVGQRRAFHERSGAAEHQRRARRGAPVVQDRQEPHLRRRLLDGRRHGAQLRGAPPGSRARHVRGRGRPHGGRRPQRNLPKRPVFPVSSSTSGTATAARARPTPSR